MKDYQFPGTPWRSDVHSLPELKKQRRKDLLYGLAIYDSNHDLVALVHGKDPEEIWERRVRIICAVNKTSEMDYGELCEAYA